MTVKEYATDVNLSVAEILKKCDDLGIEVKSGERYTYSSIEKLMNKYREYLAEPIIIHTKDLKEENGILYIPVYMTELL